MRGTLSERELHYVTICLSLLSLPSLSGCVPVGCVLQPPRFSVAAAPGHPYRHAATVQPEGRRRTVTCSNQWTCIRVDECDDAVSSLAFGRPCSFAQRVSQPRARPGPPLFSGRGASSREEACLWHPGWNRRVARHNCPGWNIPCSPAPMALVTRC